MTSLEYAYQMAYDQKLADMRDGKITQSDDERRAFLEMHG